MQKVKNIALAVAGLGIFSLLAYRAYTRNRNFVLSDKTTNSSANQNGTSTPKDENNLYTDSSGFSFEYPKSYKILDITPADTSYYSKVEILKEDEKSTESAYVIATDSSIPKIIVSVKDGIYETPKEAQKVASGTTSIASQNQGFYYLIESPKSQEWENILNLIAKTFTLKTN